MNEFAERIERDFPVRRKEKEKVDFRTWLVYTLKELGYSPKLESGTSALSAGGNVTNVVVGDIEKAKSVLAAHYDTGVHEVLPPLICPTRPATYMLYEALMPLLALAVSFLISFGVTFALNMPNMTLPLFLLLLVVTLFYPKYGKSETNNKNANTSGVVALLEVAKALTPRYRGEVCFLFLDGGSTVFLFQLKQGADSCNIPGVFLLCTALAQMLVRDVEIPGSFRRRFSIQGFIQGSSIREGLHFSVHHGRDGQRIQFLVRELRLLRLVVVMLQFLVRNADQFRKIQSLQFCFGQIFQTFVLPLVYQHLTQIPFHPVSHQIHINLNGNLLVCGVGVGDADLGQIGEVRLGVVFLQAEIPDQVFCMGQGTIRLCADGWRVILLFLVGQVAVGLNHQVDILFHLCPFQGGFLVVGVMVEFQPFPVMVDKASAAVQKIVGVPTDAVFLCQCLGTEIAIRLALVQCHNALLTTCKS